MAWGKGALTFGELFPQDTPMQLLERTQLLLSQRMDSGMTLRAIADASRGKVKYDWLKRFACGDIPNPGVTNVQTLHDCLIKIPANAA